ncbi:hypothetical protein [Symbiopectobacterium purcellii]|uniref:Uncharacterized protein n=1 Tax=Symbiopectobacterium purcellii TaxID=2871826 RepID=A0ABX9AQ38_9ENTR|nr:hypothetical protein [Symbiopectobacterium purcellii]QZN97137.1 hypothetical protein K6K13_07135 [Symbiopectobacterium purcellii]
MRVFFKKITLMLFVFSMGFTSVHAASVNCDKATLAAEFAICGNEIQEPKLSADNPIPILFDKSLIHNSSTLLSEAYWSNPQNNLFGKPVIQWTETDFSYVVFRLNKEMDADLASTRSFYLKRNLKTKPEDDSVYQSRARDIHIFIENIPRFKYWIQQANVKLKEQEYLQQQRLLIENQKKADKDKEKEITNLENKRKHIAQSELKRVNTIKILAFLSVVAVFAIYIWNKFIRKRYSRCKSLNFVVHDITELERFKGHVKVQEKNSRGVNTRAVSATLTINEYDYRCKDCGHQWFEKKKEELGANL